MAQQFQRRLFLSTFRRSFTTSSVQRKEVDLVADAYIKQLREITAKQQAAGGDILESAPEFKKELNEQLDRLAKKFQLASTEVVTKLNLQFDKPTVESSVEVIAEGKPIEQCLEEFMASKRQYDVEQAEKRQKAQEMRAKTGQDEEEYPPFPMPLKESKTTKQIASKQ